MAEQKLMLGDRVKTINWGPQLDGKVHTVVEIETNQHCESGTLVLINNYPNWLDSNWLKKE